MKSDLALSDVLGLWSDPSLLSQQGGARPEKVDVSEGWPQSGAPLSLSALQ